MSDTAEKKVKTSFKYSQIKTDLSIDILNGNLPPHKRLPSLNEITQQYPVSKITARRVLNDLAMEGLAYTVQGKGTFVADLSTYPSINSTMNKNLGVVFEEASSDLMGDLIKGIDEEAYRSGVQINLCISHDSFEREAEILKRLSTQGIKKILLFMVLGQKEDAPNTNLPLYLNLQEQGVQILLIDCYIPQVQIPSLSWDNYGGMKKLVNHMKEEKRKKLLYITRVTNAITIAKRMEGFKDGLLENQLNLNPDNIIKVRIKPGETFIENSYKVFSRFLKKDPDFDSILCSDEEVASGVFKALKKNKTIQPAKIKMGGFGNPNAAERLLTDYPFVLIEQDSYKMGKKAAKTLIKGFPNGNRPINGSGEIFREYLPEPMRFLESSEKEF